MSDTPTPTVEKSCDEYSKEFIDASASAGVEFLLEFCGSKLGKEILLGVATQDMQGIDYRGLLPLVLDRMQERVLV